MVEVSVALLTLPLQLIGGTGFFVALAPIAMVASLLLLVSIGLTGCCLNCQDSFAVRSVCPIAIPSAVFCPRTVAVMPVLAWFAAIEAVLVGVSDATERSVEISVSNASQDYLLTAMSTFKLKANAQLVIERLACGVFLRPNALAGNALPGIDEPWL